MATENMDNGNMLGAGILERCERKLDMILESRRMIAPPQWGQKHMDPDYIYKDKSDA